MADLLHSRVFLIPMQMEFSLLQAHIVHIANLRLFFCHFSEAMCDASFGISQDSRLQATETNLNN